MAISKSTKEAKAYLSGLVLNTVLTFQKKHKLSLSKAVIHFVRLGIEQHEIQQRAVLQYSDMVHLHQKQKSREMGINVFIREHCVDKLNANPTLKHVIVMNGDTEYLRVEQSRSHRLILNSER